MDEYKEINPEYVYLMIPSNWVGIYHRILVALADIGKINNCCDCCNEQTNNIINCWNLFQSALASNALGYTDSANKIIEYLNRVLEYMYKGSDKDIYDKSIILPIDDKGELKAIVTYDNNYPKFKVKTEVGSLYEEWKSYQNDNKNFKIENSDLIVEK